MKLARPHIIVDSDYHVIMDSTVSAQPDIFRITYVNHPIRTATNMW